LLLLVSRHRRTCDVHNQTNVHSRSRGPIHAISFDRREVGFLSAFLRHCDFHVTRGYDFRGERSRARARRRESNLRHAALPRVSARFSPNVMFVTRGNAHIRDTHTRLLARVARPRVVGRARVDCPIYRQSLADPFAIKAASAAASNYGITK